MLRLIVLAAVLAPGADAFLAPSYGVSLRGSVRSAHGASCLSMKAEGAPQLRGSRAEATRWLLSGLVAAPLAIAAEAHAAEAAVAEEEAAVAEEAAPAEGAAEGAEDEQILSFEGINFKKLGVTGGAFVAADIIAALVTGRSILKIVNGNEDPEDWKTKAVNKMMDKEKADAAKRMGISAVTSAKPRGPSATGDFAKTDPFEIAKEKYKKKESIEDLKKGLSAKLDTKKATGFDQQDEE